MHRPFASYHLRSKLEARRVTAPQTAPIVLCIHAPRTVPTQAFRPNMSEMHCASTAATCRIIRARAPEGGEAAKRHFLEWRRCPSQESLSSSNYSERHQHRLVGAYLAQIHTCKVRSLRSSDAAASLFRRGPLTEPSILYVVRGRQQKSWLWIANKL